MEEPDAAPPLSLSRPKRSAAAATQENILSSLRAQDARIPTQPSAPRTTPNRRTFADAAPEKDDGARGELAASSPPPLRRSAAVVASASQALSDATLSQVRTPCQHTAFMGSIFLLPCLRPDGAPDSDDQSSRRACSQSKEHGIIDIDSTTWDRYNTYAFRLRRWCDATQTILGYQDGRTQDGKSVRYPVVLDDAGSPLVEAVGNPFLRWLTDQPDLPTKDPLKIAQKYLTASANLERDRRGMKRIDPGAFNTHTEVRVAAKQQRRDAGNERIVACKDMSKRSDHLPSFEEKQRMMHLALAGDRQIHAHPLRALQTGVEVCLTHTTGIRGEKVRSATFDHLWPRSYDALACGEGLQGTVFYNTRKGKTNDPGEATHAGWVPSCNPLFDVDGGIGLCLLYRLLHDREPFPDVCADRDGQSPGYRYKWLPLFRLESTHEVNAAQATLEIHPFGEKPQNACWKMLFNAAGVEMYKGDSVTHGGRAACNQEWREAGGDPRVSDEALGYTHDVSKDHYAPQIPLMFALQRCHHGLRSPEHLSEVDAAHLRAGRRAAKEPLRQLVDLAVPELSIQKKVVEAINTTAANSCSRKSVNAQRAANPDTHKREHQNALAIFEHTISMAILDAAARPRKRDRTIDYEANSLIEEHGAEAVYAAIRIRPHASVPAEFHDTWLFEHPLFKRIAVAVREEEERERSEFVVSGDRLRTASAAAHAVLGPVLPMLANIQQSVTAQNAIATADDPAWTPHYARDDVHDVDQSWARGGEFHARYARACAAALLKEPERLATVLSSESSRCGRPGEVTYDRASLAQTLQTLAVSAAPHARLPFDYALAHLRSHVAYAQSLPDWYRLMIILGEHFARMPGHPRRVEEEIDSSLYPLDDSCPPPPPAPSNSDNATVAIVTAAAAAAVAAAAASAPQCTTALSPVALATVAGPSGPRATFHPAPSPIELEMPCTSAAASSSLSTSTFDASLLQISPPGASMVAPMALSTSTGTLSSPIASTSDVSTLDALATVDGNSPKRRRRDDLPGLPQAAFCSMKNIEALWNEYVDVLLPRNEKVPGWRTGNKPSRDLYNDKMFFYREIAGKAASLGSVEDALAATQERLEKHATKRHNGWKQLLNELQAEQKEGSDHKKTRGTQLDVLGDRILKARP